MPLKALLAAVTGAALLLPASAQAHVTLNPNQAPAGGFTQLDVRVPNEQDKADTTKLDLKLPDGFASASYEPMPGWSVKVYKSKLATPIKTDDGLVTEQISRIVWTGSGTGVGKIGPGEFLNFPLSVQVPGKAGDTLTFKALQTYSNGQVVRWIGSESSNTPAPTVKVTTAAGAGGHAAAAATPAAAKPVSASTSDGSGSDGLAIAALIVGIVALAAAGAALAGRRRVRATA